MIKFIASLFILAQLSFVSAASAKPNIIFLLADDQRADALSCAGNELIQTPNLDALATFHKCLLGGTHL